MYVQDRDSLLRSLCHQVKAQNAERNKGKSQDQKPEEVNFLDLTRILARGGISDMQIKESLQSPDSVMILWGRISSVQPPTIAKHPVAT